MSRINASALGLVPTALLLLNSTIPILDWAWQWSLKLSKDSANYIYGDPDRVLKLHQAYGCKAVDGYYSFPCNGFPDVTLTFGGKQFTIPVDEFNLGLVEKGSPDCFSGIVDNTKSASFWSIGSNFLQLFYTVFNMDSDPPQVGFAHLEESSDSEA